jgi:ribonuclease HII
MVIVAGVDDAGRGPMIGPMVLAGVSMEEKDLEELKSLNVKDSKLLTKEKREELYPKIIEMVKDYHIVVVPASEIDIAVESETTNLNWLESEKFAIIANYLKPDRLIVDCPSVNTVAYKEHLRTFIKSNMNIACEHKADYNHAIVAAASILAKVTRDNEIEKLKETYGEFGSGYPSDPRTKDFLMYNWQKCPELFRKSWASYKRVADKGNQSSLGDY